MDCKKWALLFGLLLSTVPLGAAAEKRQIWTEVRSPHFVVDTNSNAKQGRRIADEFEQIRAVFRQLTPKARVDPGVAFRILAVKDEKSLRELLPAFWEQKGHMHPAGYFSQSLDADYVALRLDIEGPRPYEVLYHEYIHLLVSLSLGRIPVWANEGLAEFWGNTDVGDKELTVGNYSLPRLVQLHQSKMLPLDVLFTADDCSPYYNEKNKSSVFYAESWALVHMLILGNNRERTAQWKEYVSLVADKQMGSLDAARRAFGDLDVLWKELSAYVNQTEYAYRKIRPPAQLEDKDFPSRELPEAEALAVRGDFYAHTQRPAEARSMLGQALALDPKLPLALEASGALALQEGDLERASGLFAQAADLDSSSFLSHYYAASLALRRGPQSDGFDKAEAQLNRAIELNPEFAESYSMLAHLYVLRDEKLDDAVHLEQRAIALDPGNFSHRINLGYVLLRMSRTAEAREYGEQLEKKIAHTPEEIAKVQEYLRQVDMLAEFQQDQAQRQERLVQEGVIDTPGDARGDRITTANGSMPPLARRKATALGKITAVSCDAYRLKMTFESSGHVLTLSTQNYNRLEFDSVNWTPPQIFNPCRDLQGREARVVYLAAEEPINSGTLLTVEVHGPEVK